MSFFGKSKIVEKTVVKKEVVEKLVYVPVGNDVLTLYYLAESRRLYADDPVPDWHGTYWYSVEEAFAASGNKGSVSRVKALRTDDGSLLYLPDVLKKLEVKEKR